MKISIVSPWSGSTAHLYNDFCRVVTGIDEIIVVDDASDDATSSRLRMKLQCPQTVYLHNDERRGFAAACNRGYRSTTGDVVAFLNSDVKRPSSKARGYLVEELRNTPLDAIVGPDVRYQTVWAVPWPYVDGWLVSARRETWEKLVTFDNNGPWDAAAFPTPYWEDVDLALRAHLAGIKVVEAADWKLTVQHKGGGTMGSTAKWGESYEKNRATFAERARHALEKRP